MMLDSSQLAVVNSTATNILCVAGPGSGKTRILVARIERLIKDGVEPKTICVVTFTNSGAKELQKRLPGIKLYFCGTLHSLMLRLLQRHGSKIGLPETISVLDEDSSQELLEQVRDDMRVRCSTKVLNEAVKTLREKDMAQITDLAAIGVAKEYFRLQKKSGEFDFDSLLDHGLKLIQQNPDVVDFDYLFVDEFQDSAKIDMQIYQSMVACVHKFYVGDQDQNLFTFRGTTVENILRLQMNDNIEKHYLRINYRSGSSIIVASQKLIQQNKQRVSNLIEPRKESLEGIVSARHFHTAISELGWISSVLDSSCAVLFRTNALAKQAYEHFQSLGIKVAKKKPVEKDSPEAILGRGALAVMCNPYNDRAVLRFIKYRYGDIAARKAQADAVASMSSVFHSCTYEIPNIGTNNGRENITCEVFEVAVKKLRLGVLSQTVIDWLIESAQGMAEISSSQLFTLSDLLLALSRHDDSEPDAEGVFVGTYHAAKGREWDVVFCAGLEDECFPGRDEEESARRLLYVGMTRAKSKLIMSWCKQRQASFAAWKTEQRKPSRFLKEIFE